MSFTDDPVRDFERYDREQEEECYCVYCERILRNERVLRIRGDLYCMDCADEKFGEEV